MGHFQLEILEPADAFSEPDAGGTVEFNVRTSTWRADPAAKLLCLLMDERAIAATWLIPMNEFKEIASLKRDKCIPTPSSNIASRNRYSKFRIENFAVALR